MNLSRTNYSKHKTENLVQYIHTDFNKEIPITVNKTNYIVQDSIGMGQNVSEYALFIEPKVVHGSHVIETNRLYQPSKTGENLIKSEMKSLLDTETNNIVESSLESFKMISDKINLYFMVDIVSYREAVLNIYFGVAENGLQDVRIFTEFEANSINYIDGEVPNNISERIDYLAENLHLFESNQQQAETLMTYFTIELPMTKKLSNVFNVIERTYEVKYLGKENKRLTFLPLRTEFGEVGVGVVAHGYFMHSTYFYKEFKYDKKYTITLDKLCSDYTFMLSNVYNKIVTNSKNKSNQISFKFTKDKFILDDLELDLKDEHFLIQSIVLSLYDKKFN